MIIPFIRSSLIGSYEICAHKAFLVYNVGLKEGGRFSADAGTAVHKALELLAQKKLAIQNKELMIENEIFDTKIWIKHIDANSAFDMGWNYCSKITKHEEWGDYKAKQKYIDMYHNLLYFHNGHYNPLNLEIIQPEQFFDIEIKEDWARYDYTVQGEKFSGFLSIKGTMDLIFQNDGYLSGMDYKTGSRTDWATGKTKDAEYLKTDKQLLLYSYAINHLFKQTDFSIIMYYLQSGGPYEILFDKNTLKLASSMIKDYFWKINKNVLPALAKNSSNSFDKRKCNWCDFNKVDPKISKSKTVCDYYYRNIVDLGMDKVIQKHADKNRIFSYNTGGGRGLKDKEKE